MAEICRFYGIIIRIHNQDHQPPHFHVQYGEYYVRVSIEDSSEMLGRLPPRARRLVREWASLHREELREAWERAQRMEPPGKIAPLE